MRPKSFEWGFKSMSDKERRIGDTKCSQFALPWAESAGVVSNMRELGTTTKIYIADDSFSLNES